MVEDSCQRPKAMDIRLRQLPSDGRATVAGQRPLFFELNGHLMKPGAVADKIRMFQQPPDNDQEPLSQQRIQNSASAISPAPVPALSSSQSGQDQVNPFEAVVGSSNGRPATLTLQDVLDSRRKQPSKILKDSQWMSTVLIGDHAKNMPLDAQSQPQQPLKPPIEGFLNNSSPNKRVQGQIELPKQSHSLATDQEIPLKQKDPGDLIETTTPASAVESQLQSSEDTSNAYYSSPSCSHLQHHNHHAHGCFEPAEDRSNSTPRFRSMSAISRTESEVQRFRRKGNIAEEITAMIDRAIQGRSDSLESRPGSSPANDESSSLSRRSMDKKMPPRILPRQTRCNSSCSDHQDPSPGKLKNVVKASASSKLNHLDSIDTYGSTYLIPASRNSEDYNADRESPADTRSMWNGRIEEETSDKSVSGDQQFKPNNEEKDPCCCTDGTAQPDFQGEPATRKQLTGHGKDPGRPLNQAYPDFLPGKGSDHGLRNRTQQVNSPRSSKVNGKMTSANTKTPSRPVDSRQPGDPTASKRSPFRFPAKHAQQQIGHSRRLRWWRLVLSEKKPSNAETAMSAERERRASLHGRADLPWSSGRNDLYKKAAGAANSTSPPLRCHCNDRMERSPFDSPPQYDNDPFVDQADGAYVDLYGVFDATVDALESILGSGGEEEEEGPFEKKSDPFEETDNTTGESIKGQGRRKRGAAGKRKISGTAHPEKDGSVKIIINIGDRLKEKANVDLQSGASASAN